MTQVKGKYLKQSKEERLALLKEKCNEVVDFSYQKPFTAKQLQEVEEQMANWMVELLDLEEELSALKEEYRDKITPIKTDLNLYTGYVKYKSRLVSESCYKFLDTDTKKVLIYNDDGKCVEEREATVEELQLRIGME